jgi:hypothetical protein
MLKISNVTANNIVNLTLQTRRPVKVTNIKKSVIIWDMAPSRLLEMYRRFGFTARIKVPIPSFLSFLPLVRSEPLHQPTSICFSPSNQFHCSAYSSTLQMDTAHSSETSVSDVTFQIRVAFRNTT